MGIIDTFKNGVHGIERLPGKARKTIDELSGKAAEAAREGIGKLLPDEYVDTPKLPAYTKLPEAERAKAEQRSKGISYRQRLIQGTSGRTHEPVNLVLTGTKAEVFAALKRAGWTQAEEITPESGVKTLLTVLSRATRLDRLGLDYDFDGSPVSNMYLGGKRHIAAFNKNNENNHGRDHLRIFETGKRDTNGRPIWEIAATRDTTFGIRLPNLDGFHRIDHHLDPERDMVMADLLKTGAVKDWKVADGERTLEDDEKLREEFKTDGKLYLVELDAQPTLKEPAPPESGLRRLLRGTPSPLRDRLKDLDEKITQFFKGFN